MSLSSCIIVPALVMYRLASHKTMNLPPMQSLPIFFWQIRAHVSASACTHCPDACLVCSQFLGKTDGSISQCTDKEEYSTSAVLQPSCHMLADHELSFHFQGVSKTYIPYFGCGCPMRRKAFAVLSILSTSIPMPDNPCTNVSWT